MRWPYCFLLSIVIRLAGSEEFCYVGDGDSCGGKEPANFSKRDEHGFIDLIRTAEESYVPCNNTSCGCYKDVIARDLRQFKSKGITKELINAAKSRGTLYQIIDGKLYRQKDCMFPSRCAGIEYFILKVINKLPDMELVVNTRDYPQSSKHFGEPLPIFSFSKTLDYYDITYPAWSFWEGGPAISLYPRGLGRWDEHRTALNKASERTPWEKKDSKAFFRGSRTSSERDNLILLSRKEPNLVDAQYTRNQAWKSEEDTLGMPPAPEVPLESHCKYKYLFNYRGVAASFRHKHLFLCSSLVIHVGDEWTEFYYNALVPWYHYVPVSKDASQKELKELTMFAKENDAIVRKIAKNGRDFIWNNLRMSDVVCYWKRLLKKYAQLLKYKPTLSKQLIRIGKK